jgi:hypothetical protein
MVETKKIGKAFEKYAKCNDFSQIVVRARERSIMRAVNQEVWKEMVGYVKKTKDKVVDLFR